jgi:hypothetical protein
MKMIRVLAGFTYPEDPYGVGHYIGHYGGGPTFYFSNTHDFFEFVKRVGEDKLVFIDIIDKVEMELYTHVKVDFANKKFFKTKTTEILKDMPEY